MGYEKAYSWQIFRPFLTGLNNQYYVYSSLFFGLIFVLWPLQHFDETLELIHASSCPILAAKFDIVSIEIQYFLCTSNFTTPSGTGMQKRKIHEIILRLIFGPGANLRRFYTISRHFPIISGAFTLVLDIFTLI